MAAFVKLQKDFDGQRFHLIVQEDEGGFRFEVESDDNDLMIEGLSQTLSTIAAVEALHVLTDTKLCLSDKRIEVQVNKSTSLSIKAAWISVFEVSQQCIENYRKDVIEYLDGRGIHDLEEVIRYAYCSNEMVREKAWNKLKSFKFEKAEQRAKIYDLCVDLQIEPFFNNAPLESETLTETERFWTKYCLQAIKRIPTIVYLRPPLPTSGIERVVAQVGGIANVALFEPHENLNLNEVMQALVCQKKGAESWYENVRVMRVWGKEDVDQVISNQSNTFKNAMTEKMKGPDYILRKGLLAEIRERWEKLRDEDLHHYIPLDVTSLPNSPVRNDLNGVIDSFLADAKKRTFLLQGDSGSGKTSFARYLEWKLIEDESEYLPLYFALNPKECLKLKKRIEAKVKEFDGDNIKRHKKEQKFLFILDGYDETQKFYNLLYENDFQDWQKAKVLFTCRSQYLTRLEDYREQFVDCNASDSRSHSTFDEWYLAPFDLLQREKCIDSKLLVLNNGWCKSDYIKAFESAPRLNEIVTNPFMLTIALEVLPELVKENSVNRIDRVTLFRSFVRRRFHTNKRKPKSSQVTEKQMFEYSKGLACYLYKLKKLPFEAEDIRSYEKRAAKDKTLPEELYQDKPPDKLLRIGCPLSKIGDNQFEFLHRSLYEYFVAAEMYETIKSENSQPLSTHFLSSDMAIVDFIVEMLWSKSETDRKLLTANLFNLINQSKNFQSDDIKKFKTDDNDEDQSCDEQTIKASSNSATILARAGIAFSGRNLSGVRLDKANLNGGIFHYTNLTGACLKETSMHAVQLIHAQLQHTDFTNADTGEHPYIQHSDQLRTLAHHPYKPWIAIGSTKGKIEVWSTENSTKLHTIPVSTDSLIIDTTFSDCGNYFFVSWCHNKHVGKYKIKSDEEKKSCYTYSDNGWVECHHYYGNNPLDRKCSLEDEVREKIGSIVTGIAISNDSAIIAFGDLSGNVNIWKGDFSEKIKSFNIENIVTAFCLSNNGFMLAAACKKNKIHLFKINEDKCFRVITGHNMSVQGLCFDLMDTTLISCSSDKTIRMWSINERQVSKPLLPSPDNRIHSISFTDDGNQVLSGGWEGEMTIINFSNMTCKKIQNERRKLVFCTSFTKDGSKFLTGTFDKLVTEWDVSSGRQIHCYEALSDMVFSARYFNDDKKIIACDKAGNISIWNAKTHKKEFSNNYASNKVVRVNSDLNGKFFLLGRSDGQVLEVKNFKAMKPQKYLGLSGVVNCITYSSKHKYTAAGDGNGNIAVWKTKNRKRIFMTLGQEKGVVDLCFSPDENWVLSGGRDCTARIWSIDEKNKKKSADFILKGHHEKVMSVAWNKNNIIATGSYDKSIALWEKMVVLDGIEQYCMVWRSGLTPILSIGALIDDDPSASFELLKLLEQRKRDPVPFELDDGDLLGQRIPNF